MSVLGLKFVKEFKQYLVEEDHADWGHHYIFRFPNNYGASVIKNSGSYGSKKDLWEMAIGILHTSEISTMTLKVI